MQQNVWPIEWPTGVDLNGYDDQHINAASELAINTLRSLTLNRVGQALVRARPSTDCGFNTYEVFSAHMGAFFPSRDLLAAGAHFRHPFQTNAIRLVAPVSQVIDVKLNGNSLPVDSYRIIDGGYLKLEDQQIHGRDVEIEYVVGYPVSYAGQYAAGLLAAEYLKAMSDPDNCALPRGVTEISRQGVTMTIESGLFPGGQTGIPDVDAFVYQWNPHGLKTKPTIHSPDINGRKGAGDRW